MGSSTSHPSQPTVNSGKATTSIQEGGLHVFEVHTPSATFGATSMIVAIIFAIILLMLCYSGVRHLFANYQYPSRQPQSSDYHPYEVVHYSNGPAYYPSLPPPNQGQQSNYETLPRPQKTHSSAGQPPTVGNHNRPLAGSETP